MATKNASLFPWVLMAIVTTILTVLVISWYPKGDDQQADLMSELETLKLQTEHQKEQIESLKRLTQLHSELLIQNNPLNAQKILLHYQEEQLRVQERQISFSEEQRREPEGLKH